MFGNLAQIAAGLGGGRSCPQNGLMSLLQEKVVCESGYNRDLSSLFCALFLSFVPLPPTMRWKKHEGFGCGAMLLEVPISRAMIT